MAAPANRNFCITQNDLWAFNILIRDKATKDPLNLTGATIRMQLRTSASSDTVAFEFTNGSGVTVPTPTNGRAEFSKIAAIAVPADYVYDLEVDFGSGPTTYIEGRVKVLAEVSRAT